MPRSKRNTESSQPKILVNAQELGFILSICKPNAEIVGEKAGALTRIGSKKLYNVQIVTEYLKKHKNISL